MLQLKPEIGAVQNRGKLFGETMASIEQHVKEATEEIRNLVRTLERNWKPNG